MPHKVALVAYDGLRTYEYGIAVEVFALQREGLGVRWYDTFVVSPDKGRLKGIGGVEVVADKPLTALSKAATIVIAGWRDTETPAPRPLLDELRKAHRRGARLVSICTGSFPLADAGLLDGRRATTHWLHAATFKRRFPKVAYEDDVLYVDEGRIITAAGSASGVDACLHVVRLDFGAKVANMVARRMVVATHRDGGQAQYVEAPVAVRAGRGVGQAMDWARKRLDQPLRVEDLAARSNMSGRTFLRRFRESAGMSPVAWLTQQRVARARELLEASRLTHDEVALQCGYETTQAFRAAFRKIMGVAPSAYREKFSRR
jgi:AraC family transcriptional activator FtrA